MIANRGKKKGQGPGASLLLGAALALTLFVAGFLLWQGNGLSAKLQAARKRKRCGPHVDFRAGVQSGWLWNEVTALRRWRNAKVEGWPAREDGAAWIR